MENQALKGFISFPGKGKNGHTLIASLLDTHPQIAIANSYLKEWSIEHALKVAKDPKQWSYGAKYNFTNIGQGRWENLQYVGITDFSNISYGCKSIYINVYRDSFKVIESRNIKLKNREAAVNSYENSLKEMKEHPGINIDLEEFVLNPIEGLRTLFHFLELNFTNEYLKTITNVVRRGL